MRPDIEQIARVCHEANRAYCQSIGDNSQPEWELTLPGDWQRSSAISGVTMHLDALRYGRDLNPAESHAHWLAQKIDSGWTYGKVKNPDTKQHPCVLPYEKLPVEQRMKDYLFGSIVKAFFDAYPLEQSEVA